MEIAVPVTWRIKTRPGGAARRGHQAGSVPRNSVEVAKN